MMYVMFVQYYLYFLAKSVMVISNGKHLTPFMLGIHFRPVDCGLGAEQVNMQLHWSDLGHLNGMAR